MKTTTKIVAGTIAALSLATASAVFAHQGMGPGMGMDMGPGTGPGMGMGYGMGHGMRGGMHGPESAAVTAARLSDLKAELKIMPAQDSAWQAYATVVQQQAAAREAMRTQMQAQMQAQMQEKSATAPVDRSARHEAMSQLREQHFAARSAAVKDLYAVLTPEQKTLAEQRLSVMPGHGMAWRAPAK
jgi:hypothetical protein